MKHGGKEPRKTVDIFSQNLPFVYFQPAPPLSFVTYKKAEFVLEDIANVIAKLMGVVQTNDRYKLTFHVNKLVDKGRFIDKKTRKKKFEKVQVLASVKIWTLQGQQKTLNERTKALEEVFENKHTLTDEQKEAMDKKIPPIKSIAVFRSEGNSEAKHLFPKIYSDILEMLPADIICKDFMYDRLKGEYK